MILDVTACDFPRGTPILVYATGPGVRWNGHQMPPYGVGQFVGTISPVQQSSCKTKTFTVRWTNPGTYRLTLVQRTNPGWKVSRSAVKIP